MVLAPIAAEPSPQGVSVDGGVAIPSLPAFIHAACFSPSCCLLNRFQREPLSCSSKYLKHAGNAENPRVIWHGEHVRGWWALGAASHRSLAPGNFLRVAEMCLSRQRCACPSRAGRDLGELFLTLPVTPPRSPWRGASRAGVLSS